MSFILNVSDIIKEVKLTQTTHSHPIGVELGTAAEMHSMDHSRQNPQGESHALKHFHLNPVAENVGHVQGSDKTHPET